MCLQLKATVMRIQPMSMNSIDAFDNDGGTYLKVVRFPEPSDPDGVLVLYLRPSGRFLFAGYWCGYERSVAVGRWTREGATILLDGCGMQRSDSQATARNRPFRRSFAIDDLNRTPILVAQDELRGWSLLSWSGAFVYVGQQTIIDTDGCWLPKTLGEVDSMIDASAV